MRESFCFEYLTAVANGDFNATQAAIRAGYSKKWASRQAYALLNDPKVQERLKTMQAEIRERNQVTLDEVVSNARAARENCKQLVRVGEDEEGNPIYQFLDTTNFLKANEQVGRTIGAFTDKTDLTSKGEPLKVIVEYANSQASSPKSAPESTED